MRADETISENPATLPQDRLILIGSNTDSYPYSFIDEQGKVQGFSVELTDAIAKGMNLKVKKVAAPSQELMDLFFAGKIDVLSVYSKSVHRAKTADFSVPYLHLTGAIIVRKDSKDIQSLADLRGRKVMVARRSIGEEQLRREDMLDSMVLIDSIPEALKRLSDGENDAVLASRLTAMSLAHHMGLKNIEHRKQTLEDFKAMYCYGVKPGDKLLLAKINEGLALVIASGEYQKIYDKWFGHIDRRRYSVQEITLAISIGLFLALTIAVFAALRLRKLKRRIERQARDLQISEELYRGLFESSPLAVLLLGASEGNGGALKVEQSNPLARQLLGISNPLPLAVGLHELFEGNQALLERVELALTGKGPAQFDHDRSTADRISCFHVMVSPLGEKVLLLVNDVSEAKAAAERLRKSEQQLRQTQKLEAIGTLASGIAHDFNNILTGIMGNAELAKLEVADREDPTVCINEIISNSERARTLVRQILTFSRRADSRRDVLDPTALVEEALRFLRSTTPANIDIRHWTPVPVSRIEADPTQVYQIIMNMATNAVHAMKGKSEARLEVSEENVTLGEDTIAGDSQLRAGDYVRISVKDTGCGMDSEVLQKIFEPFFTTKKQGEGTGLGLSVVHGIMQSHNGAVTVYSQPGQGSVFHLYFPVVGGATLAAGAVKGAEVPKGNGERIIFIDDEESITRAAEKMLMRLGYAPTVFTRPKDALAAIVSNPTAWAAVVSDLTMPGMGGLEIVQKVHDVAPSMPLILCSGFIGEEEFNRARQLGVVRVIDKPTSMSSLGHAIAEGLRRNQSS